MVFAFVGCEPPDDEQNPGGAAVKPVADKEAAADEIVEVTNVGGPPVAILKGVIKFTGPKPRIIKLKMEGDPSCAAAHTTPVVAETYVIGDDNSLENVVVYVKKGVTGKFKAPSEPAVLDQKGCVYKPHVLPMMAGQEMKIVNSDNSNHNIKVQPKVNQGFNVNQAPNTAPISKKFRRAEQAITAQCNVHSWMNAKIWVFDHPFFAVSGKGGVWEFKEKLSPGKYTIAAWHEKLGEQTAELTIGADDTVKELPVFEFKKK